MVNARHALALATLTLVACRSGPRPGTLPPLGPGPTPVAARAAAEASPDPVQAAQTLWLLGNDRAAALARLDARLEASPDPQARLLRGLLHREALAADRARQDFLHLLRHHPASAHSEVALALLLEDLPDTPHAAEAIEAALLEGGWLALDTAHGARHTALATALLAALAHHRADSAAAAQAAARGGYVTRLRCAGPLGPKGAPRVAAVDYYEREADWRRAPGGGRRPTIAASRPGPGVQVRLPTPRAGQYVCDALVEVSEGQGALDLQAHLPSTARVRVAEVVVVDRDAARRIEGRRAHARLRLEPGWHRITVALSADAQTTFSLALTTRDGRPASARARSGWVGASTAGDPTEIAPHEEEQTAWGLVARLVVDPSQAVLGRWLGATLATTRWYRDLDRAWWFLDGATAARPRSAALAFAEARRAFALGLSTQGRTKLQSGLRGDPTHPRARVRLAEALVGETPEAALEALSGLGAATCPPPDGGGAWQPDAIRFDAYRRLGVPGRAQCAFEASKARGAPDRVLERGVRLLRSLDRHRDADQLDAARDAVAPRGAAARAAERAERRGDVDATITALRTDALLRAPAAAFARIAELELARGRVGAASEAAQASLRHDRGLAPALKANLRIAALEGDPGAIARAIARLRAEQETTLELEALAGGLGELPPRLRARLAHDPWTNVRPAAPDLPAPGTDPVDRWARHDRVVLLDRLVDLVLPHGQVLAWHHDVTRVQTKRGRDAVGEVRVPPDALLLRSRTLKPDGREVEVDRHAGKEDVSFSALALGDAVEQHWLRLEAPATAYGGYVRKFYFRSAAPLLRSELVVVVPDGTPVAHQGYHGAPEPEISTEAGLTIYHWRADDVPAWISAPFEPPADALLPFVVVSVGLDAETAALGAHVGDGTRARGSRRVDRLARTLTATVADPRARLERLFRWTVDEIEPGPARTPELTLERGRGGRAGLLVALARAAGIAADLVWVKDGLVRLEPPPLVVGRPRGPFVRARVAPDEAVWSSLEPQREWLGALPPHFKGGRMRWLDPRGPVEAPVPEDAFGVRRLSTVVDLEVDRAGQATGEVQLTLHRADAQAWRRGLRRMPRHQREQALQQVLNTLLPGAEATGISLSGMKDPLAPLTISLTVKHPRFMIRARAQLVAEEVAPPIEGSRLLGVPSIRSYLAEQTRSTPILLRPIAESQVIRLQLPAGGAVEVAPRDLDLALPGGRVAQSFSLDPATGRAELRTTYEMSLGEVAVEDLPAFFEAGHEALQGLRNRLVVTVPSRREAPRRAN